MRKPQQSDASMLDSSMLDSSILDWIRETTGATGLTVERRRAGGSRAGYAVDVTRADGSTRALWLRMDEGFGPQSHTTYTLRREAAVYRALQPSAVKVPVLVAVHPSAEAFLTERLDGANWFSRIEGAARQERLATAFMEQLAALHRLDPANLDLPELGPPTTVGEHVREELDLWTAQHLAQGVDDPLVTLALSWLERHVPDDGDWPLVLVQGDTGPGNFMFDGDELVAVMDWEMAHWGDPHDDLGWICVRDLQERFTHLPDRLRDYERFSGLTIDRARLRYFRVLAQARCAIGTANSVHAKDSRGEVANQLIYHVLHTRLLAEALADAVGLTIEEVVLPEPTEPELAWALDVALDDLREVIVPALTDPFAASRAKGVARLLKVVRASGRHGDAVVAAERDDLRVLLSGTTADVHEGRRQACAAIEAGTVDEDVAIRHCLRQAQRMTEMLRPAIGALADRHYAPIED